MEKRVFLAIFLSFGLLVVYQTYIAPPPVPPPPATATATPAPGVTPGAIATPGAPQPVPVEPLQTAPAPDAAARDILVETDAIRAVFNTQGAVLKSWKLLKYLDADGQPLELIPTQLPANHARPFSISSDDAATTSALAGAVYKPSADGLKLGSAPGTLTFQYQGANGLTARKAFYFQPEGRPYAVNAEISVDQSGTPKPVTVHFGPAIGSGIVDGSNQWPAQALYFLDGSVNRVTAANIPAQPKYQGAIRYAGVEDHYFLSAALPAADRSEVEYAAVTLPVVGGAEGATRSLVSYSIRPNPGQAPSQAVTVRFFIGPKDLDHLKASDVQLTRAIDFGWFAMIVVPLLQALKWVNGYVGNYGWSIIVLTILINVLIFPLRHKSMVSMKKMQALQPQVKAIQDRYAKFKATDPEKQKMNSEMLALYKQKGVNPASGCIPMLLTFPILIAFYNLLNSAIELRGAPFVGWIHDLASRDPTYVWPILMGATMFWQQKMTPSTADPMQQKIFMVLPVVFTIMFLAMPAGLVIYWLTSNILTIGQQYLTNHLTKTPAPAVAVSAPRKS
jgi:YidC/Oxa1 family membrane protein insertase